MGSGAGTLNTTFDITQNNLSANFHISYLDKPSYFKIYSDFLVIEQCNNDFGSELVCIDFYNILCWYENEGTIVMEFNKTITPAVINSRKSSFDNKVAQQHVMIKFDSDESQGVDEAIWLTLQNYEKKKKQVIATLTEIEQIADIIRAYRVKFRGKNFVLYLTQTLKQFLILRKINAAYAMELMKFSNQMSNDPNDNLCIASILYRNLDEKVDFINGLSKNNEYDDKFIQNMISRSNLN